MSRYSNKVMGAVFIIIVIIVIVGLATMKNEYKECAGMSPTPAYFVYTTYFVDSDFLNNVICSDLSWQTIDSENKPSKKVCVFLTEPEWLILSSTEIVVVQVFMVSGVFITR